ncbi:MAG: TRAP transporter substrate-binding protein [Lachnospiraceae bacterium]|jgi:TRAP-type C4-dicarboxylate transport system substrate-binding protein|nr:TRAP transporter substrate-binding protein [Lachnospiraceae bacterium]
MKKILGNILLAAGFMMGIMGCGNQQTAATTAAGTENVSINETEAPEKKEESAAKDTIVLRFGDTCTDESGDGQGNLKFIELVEERTDGRVKIEYYPASQLGSDKALTQACMDGTLDIAKCSAGNMSEFTDAMLFFDLPGLFHSAKHMRAVCNSEIMENVNKEMYDSIGLYALMINIDSGEPRGIAGRGSTVRVPADIAGKKIRSTGSSVEMALFDQWKASSISLPFDEVYNGLNTNVIDATYNQANIIDINSMIEVTDYFTPVNQSWVAGAKLIGKSAIENLGGLDSELFQIIKECAEETDTFKDENNIIYTDASYKKMKEKGIDVVELTDEEQAQWDAASEKVREQLVGDGKGISQELVDSIISIDPDR